MNSRRKKNNNSCRDALLSPRSGTTPSIMLAMIPSCRDSKTGRGTSTRNQPRKENNSKKNKCIRFPSNPKYQALLQLQTPKLNKPKSQIIPIRASYSRKNLTKLFTLIRRSLNNWLRILLSNPLNIAESIHSKPLIEHKTRFIQPQI